METSNYQHRNCRRHPGRIAGWVVLGITGVTALVLLFGAVIMWLWNGLMPVIFHLGVITYWQAVGLAILARLLFGSMHHGHNPGRGGRFGRWHHRRHCNESAGANKWSYYEQYWTEEGEKAFNAYVERKEGDGKS
jgi:hypothetical protein